MRRATRRYGLGVMNADPTEPGDSTRALSDLPPQNRLPALGRRGGGWVALQLVVFALAGATGWFGTRWAEPARPWLWAGAGVTFAAAIVLLLAGGAGLGRQLTPFPRPVATGQLRQDGIYRLVRHPIYGGVILCLLAWALASSPLALVTFALGCVFFEAKRRREESWLLAKYSGYEAYRGQVRSRFIPYLW